MEKRPSILIRRFEAQDANQVSRVIRETMLKANAADYPMWILQPLHDYFTPEKVLILAGERYCIVTLLAEQIVGTGALEDNEIKSLFVLSQYQGIGIGKQIIRSLEDYAVLRKIKELKVTASITGFTFYEKMGYKKGESFISKHAGPLTWMTKEIS